jgi:hypothetical protein
MVSSLCISLYQCCKRRVGEYIIEDPERNLLATLGKISANLKNIKYSIFFNFLNILSNPLPQSLLWANVTVNNPFVLNPLLNILYHRGSRKKLIGNIGENISELKKYKIFNFFQFFKHLKQPPPSIPFMGKCNSE